MADSPRTPTTPNST
ncbi:hypothetical protein EYZ11_012532 [Aspergillus tanneri]|uniref:Uncharacterized protein n=1 Tax=Aspergillus tanneri TaxID=1220188 RepID=A0A4S3J009_9EURO|nr:hypothetical protein EYZ11_012532 [Aspergillus tanneri]